MATTGSHDRARRSSGAAPLERAAGFVALLGLGATAVGGGTLLVGPALPVGHAILLAHVALGFVSLPAGLFYIVLHMRRLLARDAGASRSVAIAATGVVVGALVSGAMLVGFYASGVTPASTAARVHQLLGIAIAILLPLHVLGAGLRARTPRVLAWVLAWAVASLAIAGAAVAVIDSLYAPPARHAAVPPDYPLSPDGTLFGAAFTETAHGGLVPARALTGSERCGACHAEIAAEWGASVHRFSGVDNPLIATATRPAEEKGGVPAARFCAACHEPVALLSGGVTASAFDAPKQVLDQGVTCLVCHGVREVPGLRGNGEMVFEAPDAFPFFNSDAPGTAFADATNRILVAGFADAHRTAMRPPVMNNSQQCSSCHTVNAHEGLNGFGFVRLHNENDDWRVSAFARGIGPERKILRCQDCHMGRVAGSSDPVAARRGGSHRSHRFLAANTFVAAHLGGEEQLRETERFLRGEAFPEEIRQWLPEGPAVALSIEAPAETTAGAPLGLAVVLWNRSVGHAFPAGPNEVTEAWVELVVSDAEGRPLLESGVLGSDGGRDPEAFALVSVPVDRAGEEILVTGGLSAGFRFRRAILHGESDREQYVVEVPTVLAGQELHVRARLRYRKADAQFARLIPGMGPADVPITDVARHELRIRVRAPTR